jgi:hypothetical protein
MSQPYVGIIPVLLLLTTGVVRGIAWAKEIRFYTLTLLAMLVYALGGFTPAFEAIYLIVPGIDLFRRPADATFLVGGLLALVGGYLVHRLAEGSVPGASRISRYIEVGIVASLLAAGRLHRADGDPQRWLARARANGRARAQVCARMPSSCYRRDWAGGRRSRRHAARTP